MRATVSNLSFMTSFSFLNSSNSLNKTVQGFLGLWSFLGGVFGVRTIIYFFSLLWGLLIALEWIRLAVRGALMIIIVVVVNQGAPAMAMVFSTVPGATSQLQPMQAIGQTL